MMPASLQASLDGDSANLLAFSDANDHFSMVPCQDLHGALDFSHCKPFTTSCCSSIAGRLLARNHREPDTGLSVGRVLSGRQGRVISGRLVVEAGLAGHETRSNAVARPRLRPGALVPRPSHCQSQLQRRAISAAPHSTSPALDRGKRGFGTDDLLRVTRSNLHATILALHARMICIKRPKRSTLLDSFHAGRNLIPCLPSLDCKQGFCLLCLPCQWCTASQITQVFYV